jgi:hypothetical protein
MAQLRALYKEHPDLLDRPVHIPEGPGCGEVTYVEVESENGDKFVNLYDREYDSEEVHAGRDAVAYLPKR